MSTFEPTWEPFEETTRHTAQGDLPETVFAFLRQHKEPWYRQYLCPMDSMSCFRLNSQVDGFSQVSMERSEHDSFERTTFRKTMVRSSMFAPEAR
jgi:hypothetical protein